MAGAGRERVLVGVVAAAHGVRGLVKVRSYTVVPADIVAYGPLSDESGRRRLRLEVLSAAGGAPGSVVCRVEGIADRDAAEGLKGLRLYVERSALPAPDAEEYYQADLVGLRAELPDGSAFGRVAAVLNFGAGDILEIEQEAKGPGSRPAVIDLPFSRAVVPVVDIAGGRIVVDPPPELLEAGMPEAPVRRRKGG